MPKTSLTVNGRAWDDVLQKLSEQFALFAPVSHQGFQDYERIDAGNIHQIVYNHPRPTTPIKTFFLPVKQNVTTPLQGGGKMIILGIPACDLEALGILDEMYLQEEYPDVYYASRRENILLIGTDCHAYLDTCHCVRYGLHPYPSSHQDITLVKLSNRVILEASTASGEIFLENLRTMATTAEVTEAEWDQIQEIRNKVREKIQDSHAALPDYLTSKDLIASAPDDIWSRFSRSCVSCGACATICPTCTCFLLIDRPGLEKIRQIDACQYPGFARVAGGEDPMHILSDRFKHRYMCKYVWKPVKFTSIACTGCGRCIDACLGKISKNELLTELASSSAS